jgi:hypothetical protein
VFEGAGGTVTYLGQFETATDPPYYLADAPESMDAPSGGRVIRQVMVFRLRPRDIQPRPPATNVEDIASRRTREVPVEQQYTERTRVSPRGEVYEVDRREQRLVLAYQRFLEELGSSVGRFELKPEGEGKPIYCDLYDKTRAVLVEAKGKATRNDIRMAIGQLADYGRFMNPQCRRAILLPTRPRPDLERLLRSEGIDAVLRPSERAMERSRRLLTV